MVDSRRDKARLNRALKVAEASTCRVQHGAVIVKGGRVLAVGVNTHRNHPSVVTEPVADCTVHAEMAALRSLSSLESARGATIYVARLGASKTPRLSKPCTRCSGALENAGVKKIVYTDSEVAA